MCIILIMDWGIIRYLSFIDVQRLYCAVEGCQGLLLGNRSGIADPNSDKANRLQHDSAVMGSP